MAIGYFTKRRAHYLVFGRYPAKRSRSLLCLALAVLLSANSLPAFAQSNLGVGTPKKEGRSIVSVETDSKRKFGVVIEIIKDSDGNLILKDNNKPATQENKTALIAEKLKNQKVDTTATGSRITITKAAFTDSASNDGQTMSISRKNPKVGGIGFNFSEGFSLLEGFDGDGEEALFEASIGFEDPFLGTLDAAVSLSFSELISPTLDGVLMQISSELEQQIVDFFPLIASNLMLDLAAGEISFLFPDTALEGKVDGGTTDIALTGFLSITSVAEPPASAMFVFGLAGFIYLLRRRQKPCGTNNGHTVPNFPRLC